MKKERVDELCKLTSLVLVLGMIVFVEGVPISVAILLLAFHVAALALLGFFTLRIFGIKTSSSFSDTLALSYLTGWTMIPILISGNYFLGYYAPVIPCILVLFGLAARGFTRRQRRKTEPSLSSHEQIFSIPVGVYILTLLYVCVSVAMPFHYLSKNSIVREMYGDGVQRFGTAYALAQDIPPGNPFFSGANLSYYWFFLYPHAVLYRFIWPEMFHIWKSVQTWTAFFFLPGLWGIVAGIFRNRITAWCALIFGFFFASYEILISPHLYHAVNEVADGSLGSAIKGLIAPLHSHDPDMLAGIVTSYSDQLLMEDFLYVPQNTCALIITILGLFFLVRGKELAAIFTFSTLAGYNTFYIIPVSGAYALVSIARRGILRSAGGCSTIFCLSLFWCTICGIVPALPSSFALLLVVGALILYGSVDHRAPYRQDMDLAAWLKLWSRLLLFALMLVILLKPWKNAAILVLNYGPAFLLGVFWLCSISSRRYRPSAFSRNDALLFLISFCAIFFFLSFFLYLQFSGFAPHFVRDLSFRFGMELNLFNFYHKIAKLIRLSWAIFAGVFLSMHYDLIKGFLKRHRVAGLLAVVIILPAILTSIIRPMTYMAYVPVPEHSVSNYLHSVDADIRTTVLLEDFRNSRINQLAPVSVFYYAQWSGGNPGLTHAVGNWADQYLPRYMHTETAKRELNNLMFFQPETTFEWRRDFLLQNRIDYILTRQRFDFGQLAMLAAEQHHVFLYRVKLMDL